MKKRETKSGFLKIKCGKCKNEQNIFSHASTKINCLVCNEPLAVPKGGKARIISNSKEQME